MTTACARRPARTATPPEVAPEPAPPRYYAGLRDSLGSVPQGALRGRVFVLDPGHGGRHAGALSASGLREADVNLAVALELRDLLAAAGATVYLTRDTDREVASEAGATLRDDLTRRAALADSIQPDLFLSIHHNSSRPPDPTRNTSDIFFQLNDEGPSLDAARFIHRFLLRNLGLPPGAFTAANYRVLRETRSPAVLSEASYLTNPAIEARLATPEATRLEAEAYFLGLGHYFAAGIPAIREVTGATPGAFDPEPVFDFAAADSFGDIDPVETVASIDGVRALTSFDEPGMRLRVRPVDPLRAGAHVLELSVRNYAGNSSRTYRRDFLVTSSPAWVSLDAFPPSVPAKGEPASRITLRVFDRFGNPPPDGTALRARVDGGRLMEDSVITDDGKAVVHLLPVARRDTIRVRVLGPPPLAARVTVPHGTSGGALVWGRVVDRESGAPLSDASLSLVSDQDVRSDVRCDRAGFYFVEFPAGQTQSDSTAVLHCPGYETLAASLPAPAPDTGERRDFGLLRRATADSGGLRRLRVVVDPGGGGDQPDQVSREGLRGKDLNLRVARQLVSLLDDAGADGILTREGDIGRSEVDRVRLAEREGADVVIRIDSRPPAGSSAFATLNHYPGSAVGAVLADSIAASMRELQLGGVEVGETSTFSVQQVSAPAVEIALHVLDTEREEGVAWNGHELARIALAIRKGIGMARGSLPEKGD